jgi:hypothetical protein
MEAQRKNNFYEMLSNKIRPFSERIQEDGARVLPHMTMRHIYDYQFKDVVCAFLRKYNDETRFTTTTICSVSMVDENRFQLVRRIENAMSATPLYDRIIVDRANNRVDGYTFENKGCYNYSERYSYCTGNKGIIYNQELFKDPGFRRALRFKIHGWGTSSLTKILEASK